MFHAPAAGGVSISRQRTASPGFSVDCMAARIDLVQGAVKHRPAIEGRPRGRGCRKPEIRDEAPPPRAGRRFEDDAGGGQRVEVSPAGGAGDAAGASSENHMRTAISARKTAKARRSPAGERCSEYLAPIPAPTKRPSATSSPAPTLRWPLR